MKRTIRTAAVMAAAVLAARGAEAQDRPAISLTPSHPARWEVSGQIAWFGSNKSDISAEWDRWYSAGAGGLTLGRYWTPHLKTEIAGTMSRAGRIYRADPVIVNGQFPASFIAREHLFQATTVTAAAAYQFFENQWVHPFAGGGLEIVHERQRVDVIRQTIPSRDLLSPQVVPGSRGTDVVKYAVQPFVNAGLKVYVSEHAFVRTEVMSSMNSRGLSHAAWSGGIGVEF